MSEAAQPKEGKSLAPIEGNFSLVPRTLTEAIEYAKLISTSEIVPKNFQGKPGDVLVAVQMGLELGLKPLQALQGIAVINGKPTVYGDHALAIVQASGLIEEMRELGQSEALKKGEGYCWIKRKGDPTPVEVRFTLDDAKRAGLMGKQGPWTQYPGRMLQMRARAFALRDKFADALKGLAIREEVEDYPPEMKEAEARVMESRPAIPKPERKSAKANGDAAPAPVKATVTEVIPPPPAAPPVKISKDEQRAFFKLCREGGKTPDAVKAHLEEAYGVKRSEDITSDIYSDLCAWARGEDEPDEIREDVGDLEPDEGKA